MKRAIEESFTFRNLDDKIIRLLRPVPGFKEEGVSDARRRPFYSATATINKMPPERRDEHFKYFGKAWSGLEG
jgi:hypothetical protein